VRYLPDKKMQLPLKLLLLRGSRPKSARVSQIAFGTPLGVNQSI